jgi:hypothetical protein
MENVIESTRDTQRFTSQPHSYDCCNTTIPQQHYVLQMLIQTINVKTTYKNDSKCGREFMGVYGFEDVMC